jgi:hypothetical protein
MPVNRKKKKKVPLKGTPLQLKYGNKDLSDKIKIR